MGYLLTNLNNTSSYFLVELNWYLKIFIREKRYLKSACTLFTVSKETLS